MSACSLPAVPPATRWLTISRPFIRLWVLPDVGDVRIVFDGRRWKVKAHAVEV